MDLLRICLGLGMVFTGAGVAVHAAYRIKSRHWETLRDRLFGPAREPAQSSLEETGEPKGKKNNDADNAFFTPVQLNRTHRYEGIPLLQTGRDQHYDLENWAQVIAWLIYNRLVRGLRGRVGSPLTSAMFKGRIDEPKKMARFQWIRLFVDENVAGTIRDYYNLDRKELSSSLRKHLLASLESFLSEPVLRYFEKQLFLDVFERNLNGKTLFHLEFLPLLDETKPISCKAYLMFGAGLGHITLPDRVQDMRFRFSDGDFALRQGYLPLVEGFTKVFEIGPHPWCHFQTPRHLLDTTLTLGWRESEELGVAGILQVRRLRRGKQSGGEWILRYTEAGVVKEARLKSNTQAKLRTGIMGRQTTCELLRRDEQGETLIATLVLLAQKPPLDHLPDCAIFDNAFEQIEDVSGFAAFIATQIYLATKTQRNEHLFLQLDSVEGRTFFEEDAYGPIFKQGRKREPLRCRVKICLSPSQLNRLHEWLGDRDMTRSLGSTVLELIAEDPFFQLAFPPESRGAFLPGEGTPGLTLDIAADDVLAADTVLIRCLPIFIPNRRREIFGRMILEDWPEAADASNFSCKDRLTFFTDYPQGSVALHMSRFPVYEIVAPQIYGAVKLHFLDPGTPSAKLKIDNRCATVVQVEGRAVHRSASDILACAAGRETELHLKVEERTAKLVVYGAPRAQLDEPYFVPEPAKLELYGLTLNRRVERTGWQGSAAFRALWSRASLNENQRLEGVSMITENAYIAAVERGIQLEHHLFTGAEAVLQKAGTRHLPAKSNTFEMGSLPNQFKLWETDRANIQVEYQRLDFNRHRILNAAILSADYWDEFIDQIEPLIPSGQRVSRVELVRCHPLKPAQRDCHLYLVETLQEGDDVPMGWLFSPEGDIQRVYNPLGGQPLSAHTNGPLVGPMGQTRGRLFAVDWAGEKGTPVSFDVEDHQDQIKQYLSDGFFSLEEEMVFNPGGKLGEQGRVYQSREPLFIAGDNLYFNFDESGRSSKRCLNFNPREFTNFFDKDSFRIFYSGEAQSFVMASELHRKETITPKTVFLVIPEGGHAILGSHALAPVKLPSGVNTIVLPGLAFKFSQGPVYYG